MSVDSDTSDRVSRSGASLVFISHDTRDAELAEAFSKLLSSVSAGVLKSFRSSDKRGNQGIEYGVEWYPEIMRKLKGSSDVVCLLTKNSVGRPWILYEAGVAKGTVGIPVHGLALGIPLQEAVTGPFAQFQNSDDSEDALTQLVMQLVRRIPNAEPDRDAVRYQVALFRDKIKEAIGKLEGGDFKESGADSSSVAKLFEEVKVMFRDLPVRIEKRFDPNFRDRRKYRFPISFFAGSVIDSGRGGSDAVDLLLIASQIREDVPWFYDIAFEIYKKINLGDGRVIELINALERMIDSVVRRDLFRKLYRNSKEFSFDIEESIYVSREIVARLRDHIMGGPVKAIERGGAHGNVDDSPA